MVATTETQFRQRGTPQLGARVRELRNARGYSLRELSDECQGRPSRTQLNEVERGNRPLSGELLARVASALDVDPAELLQLGGTLSESLAGELLSGPLSGAVQRGRLVPRAYTAVRG